MFMIVTRERDYPVFELELPENFLKTTKSQELRPMFQFVLNAALDPVEQMQWQTNQMYLKCVDTYSESYKEQGVQVHCFVTPNNSKFLLLHEFKSEDTIKQFFNDVYELYTRMQLSPFFDPNERITTLGFK
jgi:hypothetical protein